MTRTPTKFILLALFASAMVPTAADAGKVVTGKVSSQITPPKAGTAHVAGKIGPVGGQPSGNANAIAVEHIKLQKEGWERDPTTTEPAQK
jgi:hypothetical protein